MLEDFSAVKIKSKEPEIPASGPGRPSSSAAASKAGAADSSATNVVEEEISDDDFAKQLQAGMAELMGEIESSVISCIVLARLYDG